MNKQVRIISVIAVVMIVALMFSTTQLQFTFSKELQANGHNTRQIYKTYNQPRGAIKIAGKKIAYSEKTSDAYGYQRYYVDSPIYSPITGFFSIANRADRGIEAAMNDELNGDSSVSVFTNIKDFILNKPKQGLDVNLTISEAAQKAAMSALDGKIGAAVAIEPSTGKILALASTPTIDANLFAVHDTGKASKAYSDAANTEGGDETSPLINRAISTVYPPGSTMKIVTSAAALETGDYTEKTLIDAPIKYRLPGTDHDITNVVTNCWASNGKETMKLALTVSCNTAFAMLGQKLGNKKMEAQAKKFGFEERFILAGQNSGFPMIAANSGFPKNATDTRLPMDSIGQGDTAISVLQDALLSSAVANKGVLMSPYIVDSLSDDGGVVSKNKSKTFGKVMSSDSADQIKDMMESVVTTEISGARISGVKVAGKSGTAQNDPN
ncbi:MAG: penicillin-binding protein 2, partial [Candidatus Ancillula sp.]|nr:penicillin-binding protein 2 [Candidatus Ancillula sp.]